MVKAPRVSASDAAEFVLDEAVDAAAAGALADGGAKVGELLGGAAGNDFDGAIVGVANPAVKAELGGFALDIPAEADALNAAGDKRVLNHERQVSQSSIRSRKRSGSEPY